MKKLKKSTIFLFEELENKLKIKMRKKKISKNMIVNMAVHMLTISNDFEIYCESDNCIKFLVMKEKYFKMRGIK